MTHIPTATTSALLDATGFMNLQYGVAFNGMITMNFRQLGIQCPIEAKHTLTRFNEFLGRKLANRGIVWGQKVEHYFLYAHEACRNHGWHVHQAVVVPQALRNEFRLWLKQWQVRAFGDKASDRAIRYTARFGRDRTEQAEHQARIIRYVLKTTAPKQVYQPDRSVRDFHDCIKLKEVRASEELRIARLAGCSQNISAKAREDGHFHVTMDWTELLTAKWLHEHVRSRDYEETMEGLRSLNI